MSMPALINLGEKENVMEVKDLAQLCLSARDLFESWL